MRTGNGNRLFRRLLLLLEGVEVTKLG